MADRRLAVEAWENLFRAQHEIFERLQADFDDAALSQPEYDVLLTVVRAPERTARLREVTANMLISQPSVSRLVDRMVTRGLVTKTADPEDGRGALVTATENGERAFRAIATRHGKHIADRMGALSTDELRTLKTLTQKLRDAL
ncbi:MarR family winged helix-turn-helix transcriptional regulator [Microbacterium sp. Marseille-Q6965]|uniref:MarR family winged helix-turn-helix transcriptional regulator n=1 Tax=Microbacterium sp. Marseille-Q6965 TaxID=2965072 RepID=UPI0021B8482B|nr:MarR family transcriptional regulator [Microbacterium sp. Marseille-Q6965]